MATRAPMVGIKSLPVREPEKPDVPTDFDTGSGVNLAKSGAGILSADEFRVPVVQRINGYSTDWYDLLLRIFSYDNNQYLSYRRQYQERIQHGASFNYKKQPASIPDSSCEEFGGRFVRNLAYDGWNRRTERFTYAVA